MVQIKDVIGLIETYAPLSLQERWDNSGIQIGYNLEDECRGVVVSLDVTLEAVEMAAQKGCNLVVCHHPLTISGVKTFTPESEFGKILALAVHSGIVVYSAHTSLDSCRGGLNDYLASLFGLNEVEVLVPSLKDEGAGLGRVGVLPEAVSVEQLAAMVKERLGADSVRYASSGGTILRVALCSGSGGSLIDSAVSSGADAYICSDLKYHNFTEMASRGLAIVDVGHFESEICAIDIFERIISEKFTTFAVLKCRNNTIHYI